MTVKCRTAVLAVALLLAGCGALGGAAGTTTNKAVAEPPCKADVPARPVFAGDTLTGDEDLWTLGTTLWSERKTRQAYELQLEVIVTRCTGRVSLP